MHSFLHCSGLYFSGNPYFCPLFIYFVDFFGCVCVCVCFFFFFVLTLDAVPDSCSTLNLFLNVVTCTQPFHIQSKWKEFGRFHKRHPFFDKYLQPHFFFLLLAKELIASKRNTQAIIFRTNTFFFLAIHRIHFHQLNLLWLSSFLPTLDTIFALQMFFIHNMYFTLTNKRYNNVFGSLSKVKYRNQILKLNLF